MLADALPLPSLPEVILAVLSTSTQVAGVVPEVTVTLPDGSVLPLIVRSRHSSFCSPAAPVMAHALPEPVKDAMLQSRPSLSGRLSVMSTSVALPSPTLLQVIV